MASAEEIRELGRATAKALRDAGKAVDAVFEKSPTTEVQSSGFLGLKKKTITRSQASSKPLGWRLWSQHLAQTEQKIGADYVTEMKIEELWLSSHGELVVVHLDHTFHGVDSERDATRASERPANDDDLAHPDYEWTERNDAPPGDPWLMRRSEWRVSLPQGTVRYQRAEQALRQLGAAVQR